ncbi:hypothetical protein CO166_05125 [Candidatus Roizmanbacteria bacterium CG_4_9_14_3_um_filter_36_11]|nr:MAG: hypothetical protein CO166_05125 [Candidatus Roizmanbacteria bacterium CG_4_9_14_3_um_filter_36_11]
MDTYKKWLENNWLSLSIIAILVLISYFNSLSNGFVSDDISIIHQDPNLPLSFFLNPPLRIMRNIFIYLAYKISFQNPLFFRLINIFFHIGVAWSGFLLLSLFLDKNVAFLTITLFAVHPILIESVGWIFGGGYPQYSFFLITSLIAYIMSKTKSKFLIISLLLYLLALLSMPDKATVFPLIILLLELSFYSLKKNWKAVAPYFILSGLIIVAYFLKGDVQSRFTEVANYQQKATFFNPFVQLPIALTSYLSLIFWPDKLTLYHSEMSFSQVEYGIRFLITLGLLGGLGIFWKKNRLIFFWLSFFIVSLLPTLLPFGWSWIVAERYVYLGTIGVLSVVGYVLGAIIKNKKTEAIGYLIFILIILGLMTRTIVRNIDWKNEDNLWIATGRTSSSDPKTHNNLGDVYGRQGDLARSAEEFKTAIKLNPYYADAYHNLGNTYQQLGKTDLALKNYQQAIKYNPSLWQSYQNMAAIYFYQGAIASAEAYLNQAIKVNPTNALLYANLAVVYLKDNDKITAKKLLEKALEINPKDEQIKKIYISL